MKVVPGFSRIYAGFCGFSGGFFQVIPLHSLTVGVFSSFHRGLVFAASNIARLLLPLSDSADRPQRSLGSEEGKVWRNVGYFVYFVFCLLFFSRVL